MKTLSDTKPSKLDLLKLHKADYVAPTKPTFITVGPARYLAVSGEGAPGGSLFESRIGALYGMAYTLKMMRKAAGLGDYGVSRLEAIYPGMDFAQRHSPDVADWRWTLLIRTPTFIEEQELAVAFAALKKRGRAVDCEHVTLLELYEGPCVQMLHVGPYGEEERTFSQMISAASDRRMVAIGSHHEIYISDPRRVDPASLKTILRQPLGPA